MTLVDTETMRDVAGHVLQVGHTVKANRVSGKTGSTFDFHGYIAAIRKSPGMTRLEALCQPFKGGEAQWLGGMLLELQQPEERSLRGTLAEWSE